MLTPLPTGFISQHPGTTAPTTPPQGTLNSKKTASSIHGSVSNRVQLDVIRLCEFIEETVKRKISTFDMHQCQGFESSLNSGFGVLTQLLERAEANTLVKSEVKYLSDRAKTDIDEPYPDEPIELVKRELEKIQKLLSHFKSELSERRDFLNNSHISNVTPHTVSISKNTTNPPIGCCLFTFCADNCSMEFMRQDTPSSVIFDGSNGYYVQFVIIDGKSYGVYPFDNEGNIEYFIRDFDNAPLRQIYRHPSGHFYASLRSDKESEWLTTEFQDVDVPNDLREKVNFVIPRGNLDLSNPLPTVDSEHTPVIKEPTPLSVRWIHEYYYSPSVQEICKDNYLIDATTLSAWRSHRNKLLEAHRSLGNELINFEESRKNDRVALDAYVNSIVTELNLAEEPTIPREDQVFRLLLKLKYNTRMMSHSIEEKISFFVTQHLRHDLQFNIGTSDPQEKKCKIHPPVRGENPTFSTNTVTGLYEVKFNETLPATVFSDGLGRYCAQYVWLEGKPYGIHPFYDDEKKLYDYYVFGYKLTPEAPDWQKVEWREEYGYFALKIDDFLTRLEAQTLGIDIPVNIKDKITTPLPRGLKIELAREDGHNGGGNREEVKDEVHTLEDSINSRIPKDSNDLDRLFSQFDNPFSNMDLMIEDTDNSDDSNSSTSENDNSLILMDEYVDRPDQETGNIVPDFKKQPNIHSPNQLSIVNENVVQTNISHVSPLQNTKPTNIVNKKLLDLAPTTPKPTTPNQNTHVSKPVVPDLNPVGGKSLPAPSLPKTVNSIDWSAFVLSDGTTLSDAEKLLQLALLPLADASEDEQEDIEFAIDIILNLAFSKDESAVRWVNAQLPELYRKNPDYVGELCLRLVETFDANFIKYGRNHSVLLKTAYEFLELTDFEDIEQVDDENIRKIATSLKEKEMRLSSENDELLNNDSIPWMMMLIAYENKYFQIKDLDMEERTPTIGLWYKYTAPIIEKARPEWEERLRESAFREHWGEYLQPKNDETDQYMYPQGLWFRIV